jgi:hypothetical protein
MQRQSQSPPRSILTVALVLAPIAGCMESLPSAPSELTTGIIVYEHANFQGESAHITHDIADLWDFNGPCEHSHIFPDTTTTYDWNDCISSVRVAPGWKATLYRDDGYGDDAFAITSDMPDLVNAPHDCPHWGLNDCVTSIRVSAQ